jgi:hypothetical protein
MNSNDEFFELNIRDIRHSKYSSLILQCVRQKGRLGK